jgi:hypothetical protein
MNTDIESHSQFHLVTIRRTPDPAIIPMKGPLSLSTPLFLFFKAAAILPYVRMSFLYADILVIILTDVYQLHLKGV